jgi:CheY-like chemotaxis protein
MHTGDPLGTSPLKQKQSDKTTDDSPSSFLVLVVDDVIDNLTVISLNLQQQGYRVATASNGEEALRVVPLVQPDLIIMDLAMPGIDGLETTRRIRENATLSEIPVIALTAFGTSGFQRAAYDTGFDGYLTKPVDFDRLHDLVRRLLALARSQAERDVKPPTRT